MKSKKKIPLSVLRKRLSLQFCEAARLLAEHETNCGCYTCGEVGDSELIELFKDIFLGKGRRYLLRRPYWLGDPLVRRGNAALWDQWREDCQECARMQRVIGLLLCSEYVKTVSRAELRACGYEIA